MGAITSIILSRPHDRGSAIERYRVVKRAWKCSRRDTK